MERLRDTVGKIDARRVSVPEIFVTSCCAANETPSTNVTRLVASDQLQLAADCLSSLAIDPPAPLSLPSPSPGERNRAQSIVTKSLPLSLSIRLGIGRTEFESLTRSQSQSQRSRSPSVSSCSTSVPTSITAVADIDTDTEFEVEAQRSSIGAGAALACPVSNVRRKTIQFDVPYHRQFESFFTELRSSGSHVNSIGEFNRRSERSQSTADPPLIAVAAVAAPAPASSTPVAREHRAVSVSCSNMASPPLSLSSSCRRSQSHLDSACSNQQPSACSTPRKEHSAAIAIAVASGCDTQSQCGVGSPFRRAVVSRLQRGAAPPLSLCIAMSPPHATTASPFSVALSPHFAAVSAVGQNCNRGTLMTPTQAAAAAAPPLHRHVERSGSTSSTGTRDSAPLETSLVRMRRTALGQSAPSLSFVPRDASQSLSMHSFCAADGRRGRRTNNLSITLSNEQKIGQSPPRTNAGSPSVSLSHGGSSTLHAAHLSCVGGAAAEPNLAASHGSSTSTSSRDRDRPAYQHSHHLRDRPRVEARRWSLPSSGYGTTPTSSSNVSSHASSKENVWLGARQKRVATNANEPASSSRRSHGGMLRGLSKDDSHLAGAAGSVRLEPPSLCQTVCTKRSDVMTASTAVGTPDSARVVPARQTAPFPSASRATDAVERSDSCRQLRSGSSATAASVSIPTSASGSHFGSSESAAFLAGSGLCPAFTGSTSATESDLHSQSVTQTCDPDAETETDTSANCVRRRQRPSTGSNGANLSAQFRPRSRSLTTPCEQGALENDILLLNHVYKERFPNATRQMEEKLEQFIEATQNDERAYEHDAIVRFIITQLLELARDCLQVAREQRLTAHYFFQLTENIEKLSLDAREKLLQPCDDLARIMQRLLLIIARPARLLECLEFDPEKFYALLCVAEGHVKETTVTDVPQYIVDKLGLKCDPLSKLADFAAAKVTGNDSTSAAVGSSSQASDLHLEPVNAKQSASIAPSRGFIPIKQPVPEDFENIKLVSNGAYGAVYLVRHKETRQRFALKKIKKVNLVLRNQVEQVYAERDIMIFLDNPFVVSLYCSFETRKHLCLVMEYVEGGDCATLVKNMGPFPLDLARIYIAETVLAIEYLHSYGIVHRDLKPDNLLITITGHIKLTDFGLSKIGLMNLTTNLYEAVADHQRSWCQFRDKQVFGTPAYIAPEVILRQGYGKPVDWWSLGVIMYEFLVGCVPFFGESPEELFQQVIDGEIEWPDGEFALPSEAVSLISVLLQLNPATRLGTGSAQEVKEHPFFDGLDWASLLRLKAEFVPMLEDEEDTSYFDTRADRYNHEADEDDDNEAICSQPASSTPSATAPSVSAANSGAKRVTPTITHQTDLAAGEGAQDSFGSHPSEPVSRQTSDHDGDLAGSVNLNASASEDIMFRSFSSCSPRYSRVYEELRQSQMDKQRHSSESSHSSLLDSRSASQASFAGLPTPNAVSSASIPPRSVPEEQSAAETSSADPQTSPTRDRTVSASQSIDTITSVAAPGLGPLAVQTTGALPTSPLARYMATNPKASAPDDASQSQNKAACANVLRSQSFKWTSAASEAAPSSLLSKSTIAAPGCTDSTPKAGESNQLSVTSVAVASADAQQLAVSAARDAAASQQQQQQHNATTNSVALKRSNSSCDGNSRKIDRSSPLSAARPAHRQTKSSQPTVTPLKTHSSNLKSEVEPAAIQVGSTGTMPEHQQVTASSSHESIASTSLALKPPLVVTRGPRGYGFTLRAIQVFYEQTDMYILQHLVTDVETGSSAFEAGLRRGDLITHVNGEAVQGLLHTDVIRLIVQSGARLSLRATPLENTTIRCGPRRAGAKPNDGRMIRPPKRAAVARDRASQQADQSAHLVYSQCSAQQHAQNAAWSRKQRAAAYQKTSSTSSSSSCTSCASGGSHPTAVAHDANPFPAKQRKMPGSSSSSTSLLRRVSTKRAHELQREQEKGGQYCAVTTPTDTDKSHANSSSKSRSSCISHTHESSGILCSRSTRTSASSQASSRPLSMSQISYSINPHLQAQLAINTNQPQPALSSSLNASVSPASSVYSGGASSSCLSSPASPSPHSRPTSLYEATRTSSLSVCVGAAQNITSASLTCHSCSNASYSHADSALTSTCQSATGTQPTLQPLTAGEAGMAMNARRRSFHATPTPISPLARTAPTPSCAAPSSGSMSNSSGVPLLTPVSASNMQQAGLLQLQPTSPLKSVSTQEPPSPLLRRALSPERKLLVQQQLISYSTTQQQQTQSTSAASHQASAQIATTTQAETKPLATHTN